MTLPPDDVLSLLDAHVILRSAAAKRDRQPPSHLQALLFRFSVDHHVFNLFKKESGRLMGSAVSSTWSAKGRIREQIKAQNPLEKANLPSMGLTAVPNICKMCPSIFSLDVSNNIITSLPEYLQRFPNLTMLNVSNNQLTSLPCFLSGIVQLKELRASDNNIRNLPDVLILPGLSTLTLCRNYLNQGLSSLLCQSFQSSLQLLHISSNGLANGVAPRIALMLTSLVELDLSLNNLGGDVLCVNFYFAHASLRFTCFSHKRMFLPLFSDFVISISQHDAAPRDLGRNSERSLRARPSTTASKQRSAKTSGEVSRSIVVYWMLFDGGMIHMTQLSFGNQTKKKSVTSAFPICFEY
jgi:hypothetical protein